MKNCINCNKMATQLAQSTGIKSNEEPIKAISTSNIPLMVVVTDVDADKLEQEKSTQVSQSQNGTTQSLYFRLTKNVLRTNAKQESNPGTTPLSSWGSVEKMAKKPPREHAPGKPATQWRKFCKCFNGLKVRKQKNSAYDNALEGPPLMSTLRPISPDLRSRLSVSPARSEQDFYLCDMASVSEILTIQDVKQLAKNFPASAVGCPCVLTFSTSEDGFSLHTLYRKMAAIVSPVIIAIIDSEGRAFGAVLSCALKVSEHFYGSGDSFLFRCGPPIEIFKWQPGANFFFIHSEENFLRIGAGDGSCGLFIDDMLYHGRTEACATFGSPPLVESHDFQIKSVEVWTFGQI